MSFVRISNTIIDPSKVSFVHEPDDDQGAVVIAFDNGKELRFVGEEALEAWKVFDTEKDWRGED